MEIRFLPAFAGWLGRQTELQWEPPKDLEQAVIRQCLLTLSSPFFLVSEINIWLCNFREEGFIWAHGLRGHGPSWQDGTEMGSAPNGGVSVIQSFILREAWRWGYRHQEQREAACSRLDWSYSPERPMWMPSLRSYFSFILKCGHHVLDGTPHPNILNRLPPISFNVLWKHLWSYDQSYVSLVP